MKRATAASYVDMAPATFDSECALGQLPPPRAIGGKDHWDRDALDKAIDALMGNGDQPEWLKQFEKKYGQAA